MENILAVVASKKELKEVEAIAGERKVKAVALKASKFLNLESKSLELKSPEDYLSDRELEEIENGAAFFARNWYKFDKVFEGQAMFEGISLGFVYENEMFRFFKNTFVLMESICNAISKEKPNLVIANRNSAAGEAVEAAAKKSNFKIEWLELGDERRYIRFPNFSRKNLREISGKLPKIFSRMAKGQSIEPGKKTVFVRGRGYLGRLEKRLREETGFNIVSLDEFLLQKLLNPGNLYKYISTRRMMRKRFETVFRQLNSKPSFRKRLVFQGMAFDKSFEARTGQASRRDWPEFVFLVSLLNEKFSKTMPNILVEWVDFVPFERICAVLARNVGAKSLVIQHGEFKAVTKGPWIRGFAPVTADKIAVWGNLFKKELEKHGVPKEKIVVTGSPKLDLLHEKKLNAKAFKQDIGVEKGKPVIVFATQYGLSKEGIREMLDETIAYCREKKVQLIVRPHPLERKEDYERIVKGEGLVLQHESLHEILNAADVVIMQASSVGLEALALRKPLIVFGKQPMDSVFRLTDATLAAKDKKALRKAISFCLNKNNEKALESPGKKFVLKALSKNDGKATDRIIDLVESMVENKMGSFEESIEIGPSVLDRGKKCFVIAEAGINHNGNLKLAKKLVDVAADAGADAVKFQTFKAEEVTTEEAGLVEYMKESAGRKKSQLELIKKYELKESDFKELKKHCDKRGIIFLTTLHSGGKLIDFVDRLVPAFKIGSGDLTNKPLLEKVAEKGKPIILATGMSTMDEVKQALGVIVKTGNREVIALHCTTSYPCPLEEVNLNAMKTMQKELGCLVGYSDHTLGWEVAAMAAAMDAVVVEKHFTIDRDLPGPDHKASLEPKELKEMVKAIRNAEKHPSDVQMLELALGSAEKRPTRTELEMMKNVRKSIVASRNVPKGAIITENMVSVKRPGTGISPMEIDSVIGKIIKKTIKKNELFDLKKLEE